MSKVFEYVPKDEFQPVIKRVESCMEQISALLKKKEIKFTWGFVGSTNRYGHPFITREVGGNKGFDIDVNIYLERPSKDEIWKASYARQTFYKVIDQVFHNIGYKNAEDRTSVIRVKFLDKQNKKIIHSCDFAVFQKTSNNDGKVTEKYARKYDNGTYGWTTRGGRNINAMSKLQWLEKYIGDNGDTKYKYHYSKDSSLLGDLKHEYLKLKNSNNDEDKCSFQLFNEALNNIYNQWMQRLKKQNN